MFFNCFGILWCKSNKRTSFPYRKYRITLKLFGSQKRSNRDLFFIRENPYSLFTRCLFLRQQIQILYIFSFQGRECPAVNSTYFIFSEWIQNKYYQISLYKMYTFRSRAHKYPSRCSLGCETRRKNSNIFVHPGRTIVCSVLCQNWYLL